MKKNKHIRLPLSIFFYLLIIGNIASAQNAWRKIGHIKPEAGSGNELSIAIDSNNIPYVAYTEGGPNMDSYKGATVKKFDGTNWQFVGQRTFSGSTFVTKKREASALTRRAKYRFVFALFAAGSAGVAGVALSISTALLLVSNA